MIPAKRIYERDFVYRDSAHTDIRKTFARVRAQQRADAAAQSAKVQPIDIKRKGAA